MARFEDYLDQATLDKLRGMQSAAPSLPQASPEEDLRPDPNMDDMGRSAVPKDQVFSEAKAKTAAPVLPMAPQGMGPLANPLDYKPSVLSEQDVDSEAGDDAKNNVLANVFANNKSGSSASPQEVLGQGFTNNTVAGLQAAQDAANARKDNADLGMAANMVMAGAMGKQGHTKIDTTNQDKYWEGQKKRGEEDIVQFEARGKKEHDDPESSASVNMREFAKPMLAKLGIKMPDNVSYSQMEKISPMVVKMFDAQQTNDTRRDLMRDKQADRDLIRDGRNDEKMSKRASDLNKLLTEEVASSRSTFGKAANIRRSAEAIDTLITQIPDKNNIDNRQMYELARSLDAMLSSGAATISGSEHLIPKSATGDLAKIQEYLSGIPKGAKQAEFVKRMQETVHRERDLASKQINGTKQKLLAGYQDLQKKSPNEYNNILKAHGIDEESTNAASSAPKNSGGRITVSNGKETLNIDPSDLPHALADGFKQVN